MNKLGPFKENTIVVGDCLDIMAQMPDECVDLVVVDPPFNLNFDYGDSFKDSKPLQEYLDWLVNCMTEAERVSKEGRLLFLWQSMKHCLATWNRFPQARLMAGCRDFLQIQKVDVQWAVDPILFWHKGGTKYLFTKRRPKGKLNRDWMIGNNVAEFPNTKGHPCPRPLPHLQYIIEFWSNKDDLIFDFFMGSGTTAVAADRLNRKFFGCDINTNYVKMALERLEKDRLRRNK